MQKIRPDIKALFASGYSNHAVRINRLQDSSVHFIQKPFSPSDLLRAVRDLLDETPEEEPGDTS
jgi:DNA-binding NtrC family response regulator